MSTRPSLDYYLNLEYPFTVAPDDGSFFIKFPDLNGCMTQVEDASEIGAMAEEIRMLWLETAYEQGLTIPEPAAQSDYSGKFVVRLPKSLHRDLAHAAEREGVSLNAWATCLLAQQNVEHSRTAHRLESSRLPVVVRSDEYARERRGRRNHLTVVSRIERAG